MTAATPTTPTVLAEAEKLLLWAKENNLFSQNSVEEVVDPDGLSDDNLAPRPARLFEEQRTKEIFRRKPINMIGYDEDGQKIVIYLHGKLSQNERESLPFNVNNDITIEYINGGLPHVKGNTPASFNTQPYYTHNDRYCCGSSIFPANCQGAGTLGFLAHDSGGQLFGVSNNHVTGACNNAQPHLPILAPGPIDVVNCPVDPFTIGRHARLMPLHDGIPENISILSNFDAASFMIADANRVSSMQGNSYDTPSAVLEPRPGMIVEKVGRTSGYTRGRIAMKSASPIPVQYKVNEYGVSKTVFFGTVYTVHPEFTDGPMFSTRGDSGSLVVSRDGNGVRHSVGIVFAGYDRAKTSFILPISPVLQEFGLTICSGLNI